jgi:hypothetical protein
MRDPESTLQRQKPGVAKMMIAGRGPISALLRCYVDLPSSIRAQYSIRLGTKNLMHLQIDRIARKNGLMGHVATGSRRRPYEKRPKG